MAFYLLRIMKITILNKSCGASDSLRNSIIPKEFYWSYLYITSTLTNLQTNIDYYNNDKYTIEDLKRYIMINLFPDFISKRVNFDRSDIKVPVLIRPELIVDTTVVISYLDLGGICVILAQAYYIILN